MHFPRLHTVATSLLGPFFAEEASLIRGRPSLPETPVRLSRLRAACLGVDGTPTIIPKKSSGGRGQSRFGSVSPALTPRSAVASLRPSLTAHSVDLIARAGVGLREPEEAAARHLPSRAHTPCSTVHSIRELAQRAKAASLPASPSSVALHHAGCRCLTLVPKGMRTPLPATFACTQSRELLHSQGREVRHCR